VLLLHQQLVLHLLLLHQQLVLQLDLVLQRQASTNAWGTHVLLQELCSELGFTSAEGALTLRRLGAVMASL
jgi:hypothetical protein